MPSEPHETLFYKRCQFITHLPVAHRYSPSHFWLAREESEEQIAVWRVGFTKFATRMLGEIVEYRLDPAPGSRIAPGQVIGAVEGFKALTELYSIVSGDFAEANPLLQDDPALISRDPYGDGWLYRVRGEPDGTCVDVEGYRAVLDAVVDQILESQSEP